MAEKKKVGYWKTKVSKVAEGEILIRGYPLEELIGNLSFAEVMFLTLRGELPSEREGKMMDALLCAIVDHEFIDSTIPSARFAASANWELLPSFAAGICAMGRNTVSPQDTGSLIEAGMKLMKDENLSREEAAARIVEQYRKEGKRVPGLGHPTHKESDPRAKRLREVAEKLGFVGDKLLFYEACQKEVAKKRFLPINVDGMMAAIMSEMNLDPLEMASIGAVSHTPGLIANIIEEIKEEPPLRTVPEEITEYVGSPKRPLPKEKVKL
jgi:citrate synthase